LTIINDGLFGNLGDNLLGRVGFLGLLLFDDNGGNDLISLLEGGKSVNVSFLHV